MMIMKTTVLKTAHSSGAIYNSENIWARVCGVLHLLALSWSSWGGRSLLDGVKEMVIMKTKHHLVVVSFAIVNFSGVGQGDAAFTLGHAGIDAVTHCELGLAPE